MPKQQSHYVTDWLDKRACLTPDRIALVDLPGQKEVTFSEWNARANRTANFLHSLGLRKGDRVSVYSRNRAEYLDLLFACGKLGIIQHNLNWRLSVAELKGIVQDAQPLALIYSGDWQAQVEELRQSLPPGCTTVALDDAANKQDRDFSERKGLSAELTFASDLNLDDPWAIFYTGGTTGLPKGAIMTHGNMTWNSINTITSWGVTAEDAAALQLPLFHIGGPNIFMLPLVHTGGRTILCREFELDQTFDLIENGNITHFVGVPTMYLMLQEHPRWQTSDFSRLKLVISGGAPCPLPVMQKFWDKGVDFKMGYGLTEAAGNNFWLPPHDVRTKIGSVGFPNFHCDMKIVRDDGAECGIDEAGELLIRGPHVTPGYWNRPEETARIIKNGWLHTGDMARRDKDGYYYVVGRSKEMFISGGENVYPAEVESEIYAHAAVTEAVVVGVPDPKWGEVGKAFVVVRDEGLSEAQLLDFLALRLARYKIPRSVVFVEALPKTPIGKVDKKALLAATSAGEGIG